MSAGAAACATPRASATAVRPSPASRRAATEPRSPTVPTTAPPIRNGTTENAMISARMPARRAASATRAASANAFLASHASQRAAVEARNTATATPRPNATAASAITPACDAAPSVANALRASVAA